MLAKISPKYKMSLLIQVEKKLWKDFESYRRVRQYVAQWQEEGAGWGEPPNFQIVNRGDSDEIDLPQTLSYIDDDTILRMAVDLGVSTPDFIPVVAEIENIFKTNYQTAQQTFQKALSQCYENPSGAVSLANSSLESIIKHILRDRKFDKLDRQKTLYALTQDLIGELYDPSSKALPIEIRNINSSLLKMVQNVEQLRSNKTEAHGKLDDDYLVSDSLYAFFIINSVATVGLFLIGYYESKYTPSYLNKPSEEESAVPDVDDIPF